MNREIKFRAWDSVKYTMILPKNLINLEGETTKELKNTAPNIILMQYTGIKDKNGKEIFEGDIIKETRNHDIKIYEEGYIIKNTVALIGFVEYVETSAGYYVKVINNKYISGYKLYDNCYIGYEIIGNIYENPELLKE